MTATKPTQRITAEHKRLGFIPNPVPEAWTHLPLMRTSERTGFTRCRLAWYWSSVERIGRIRTGNALKFGSMVHSALEFYYPKGKKRGPHPVGTFLQLYDEVAEEQGYDFGIHSEDEEWQNARELGEEMLTNYVDHWKQRDKAWKIISPEMPAMVVVLDKKGRPMCRYLMQLDLVVWDEQLGRYLFVDHKTAQSLHDPEEKVLDEQCGTYWLFGPDYLESNGLIKEGHEIRGFIYNVLRKARGDTRPQNDRGQYLNKPTKDALIRAAVALPGKRSLEPAAAKKMKVDDLRAHLEKQGLDPDQFGEVSKSQPPDLFQRFTVYADEDRRANVLDRIRKQVYEMDLVRRGKLGIYKVPQFGGVSACGNCEFYNVCVLHEDGADYQALIDLDYEPSDPYEQYRELLPIDEE